MTKTAKSWLENNHLLSVFVAKTTRLAIEHPVPHLVKC